MCPECSEVISHEALVKKDAPADLLKAVENIKFDKKMQPIIENLLNEAKKKYDAELERIMAIADADERDAELLKMHIVEEILTLKCPRCRVAFIDFDGCFALTCHKCHCGFCAWCFKDCGGDAHQHVAHCQQNLANGNVFGSKVQFVSHHRERRQRLVRDIIYGKNVKVQSLVKEKLLKELSDLKIQI